MEENAEELAQIECLELGKPIEEARGGELSSTAPLLSHVDGGLTKR